MHYFALIPYVALLVSAAFAAVSIAWDSKLRRTRSMGAVFICTALWALVDLILYLETDPETALTWMRCRSLPPLLIGPSALWVLGQMHPQWSDHFSRLARRSAIGCFALGVAAALMPHSVESVVLSPFGSWMPRFGVVSILLIPAGMLLPVYVAVEAARLQKQAPDDRGGTRRVWALRVAVALSLGVVIPTEYLLPLMEIPTPRLGAFAVSFVAAIMWLRVLHASDDLAVTPQGVARALLAELHDGVALIQTDGMILSTNSRLTQMSGRSGRDLLGQSLGSLISEPISEICIGLEDRESALRGIDDVSIPVSLSSSSVSDGSGKVTGVVVVFRDLREIDALRGQLLTSARLAAIGELAAGIAHEVNNPVAFIRSDLNLLTERLGELREKVAQRGDLEDEVRLFDRGRRRIEDALLGVERVAEIVRDVREFAHVGGAGQGGSDPVAVVEGAMRLARLQRADEVQFRIAFVACGDRIDSGQELKQVLLSLMRVLAEGAQKGARIEADLRTDAQDFVIAMSVDALVGSAAQMLARFDVLGERAIDGSFGEFGLGIAAELIDQLGGGMMVEATGPHSIRLEVSVPLHAQGGAS